MSETSIVPQASRRHPFVTAYKNLRIDLAGRSRLPGDQIVVGEVASALRISATPVREALARLSGERLVDDRRSHGYFVPLLSWFDLVELHDLCELHLGAALRDAEQHGDGRESRLAAGTERSFLQPCDDPSGDALRAVLALSRNARLVAAGQIHIEALAAARHTEAELYGSNAERDAQLVELLRQHAWKSARTLLRDEFRLRRSRAERVAFAMAAACRARNSRHIV
ncbi:GntR family transcriptional regulator [Sphingomonas sp. DT-207]|uniref:GntR family transcriptional regulator n=1 Tax=Sphingomonas sp. DT-207 TaxID=3396167 RepID=UPI003F1AE027